MAKDERLRQIDYFQLNHHLLSLLEKSDSLEYFAQSCNYLLQENFKFKYLRIAQYTKSLTSTSNLEYCYHSQILEQSSSYLTKLIEIIESKKQFFSTGINSYLRLDYSYFAQYIKSDLNINDLEELYILPLSFRDKLSGYLIIENDYLLELEKRESHLQLFFFNS